MKIDLLEMTIRDVVNGYADNIEEGVVGYGGRLNIRPKYQREFVYSDRQRDEVIRTIMRGFPLNTMYWAKNDQGDYELLDGQQRTVSFCKYFNNEFSFDDMYFHNLTNDRKEEFLNYRLFVYSCEGTDTERLDWFKVINIAGEELTPQELRNAVYTGAWLTDAKRYFSKSDCLASKIGKNYMSGKMKRQEYLETALKWAARKDGLPNIERYMAVHQHDENASQLWLYYQRVIQWVEALFPTYRKEMRGRDWGLLYDRYKDAELDPQKLEAEISRLMADDDVTNKKGVYEFVLTGDERKLSIRDFDARDKRTAYERQGGICPLCDQHFTFEEMQADHKIPWSRGGRTVLDNCQMLCADCNLKKGVTSHAV